jgi:hypothetical protein
MTSNPANQLQLTLLHLAGLIEEANMNAELARSIEHRNVLIGELLVHIFNEDFHEAKETIDTLEMIQSHINRQEHQLNLEGLSYDN